MARFVANTSDGQFINVMATKMEIKENILYAWKEKNLVAIVDIGCVLHAKLDDSLKNEIWEFKEE